MPEASPWVPPPDAVCGEEGCNLPPTGLRPLPHDMIIEDEKGNPRGVIKAGENDQIVCAMHARGLQPNGRFIHD